MKTITRSYPIICPSCNGVGYIPDPMPVTTSTHVICPACNGGKVVLVTETIEEEPIKSE